MYQIILIVVLFLIVLYLLYQNYTIQKEIYKIKNSFDELNNFLDLSIKKTKPKILDTLSSINTTDITDNIVTYSNDVKRVKAETTAYSEENKEQSLKNQKDYMNDIKLIQQKINKSNSFHLNNNDSNTLDSSEFINNVKIIKEDEITENDENGENQEEEEEDRKEDNNEPVKTLNNIKEAIKFEFSSENNQSKFEDLESSPENIIYDKFPLILDILKEEVKEEVEEVKEEIEEEVKEMVEEEVEKVKEEVKIEEVKEEVKEKVKEEVKEEELNKMNITNLKIEAKKYNIILSVSGKPKTKDQLIKDILSKNNN